MLGYRSFIHYMAIPYRIHYLVNRNLGPPFGVLLTICMRQVRFEKSHGNRNFGFHLLASVWVFENRNRTKIRFPHIPNDGLPYTKFGDGTLSHFGFIVQTNRITHTHRDLVNHYTHATPIYCYYYLSLHTEHNREKQDKQSKYCSTVITVCQAMSCNSFHVRHHQVE